MQTFLPKMSFTQSAQILDNKRLGKQRVEVLQILNVIVRGHGGWVNHPAVRMWRGYEPALVRYGTIMIREWKNRGFENTINLEERFPQFSNDDVVYIPWLTGSLCASHRANLLRKDPRYYEQFGWTEDPTAPYIWPV